MENNSKEALQKSETQDKSGSINARRRLLLRAGASSSLLLTIASRPAWAQGGMCTASALASANASGGHDFDGCSISAGWWSNFKDRWPVSHSTPFHSVFAPVHYNGSVLYSGYSLGEVIDLKGSGDPVRGSFGFHLVGAYLNAMTFPPDQGVPGYAFTPEQVVNAYNALLGVDTRSGDENSRGSSPADASFSALANTLEDANNQFDSNTQKPEPW